MVQFPARYSRVTIDGSEMAVLSVLTCPISQVKRLPQIHLQQFVLWVHHAQALSHHTLHVEVPTIGWCTAKLKCLGLWSANRANFGHVLPSD